MGLNTIRNMPAVFVEGTRQQAFPREGIRNIRLWQWVLPLFLLALAPQHNAFGVQALPTDTSARANPVIAGDHPDPSIIRVGNVYWMTSTSGDWSPQFPLFRSSDLQHWERVGAVFPQQPTWAVGSFWAPEIVYERKHVFVYYVGRKPDGPLCVAVADAPSPQGPFTDHGPLVCEPDGSIDPAFARDEHGKPYLIWKEDGNSESKPTPLWAQPLTDDLLHLTGQKTSLLQNEQSSWEGGVVEAPFVLRHGGRFYLFYAGNACCGTECKYAEGVARADHLLGPWTRDPDNPIIRPNGTWKCPGHGSAVTTPKGESYFLYHAYPTSGSIYLGRESVLDAIRWTSSGWPEVNSGHGPSERKAESARDLVDDFAKPIITSGWRWPVNSKPLVTEADGSITLEVNEQGRGSFLAQPSRSADYEAEVTVSSLPDALGSLGVMGNAHHVAALGKRGNTLQLWTNTSGKEQSREILWSGDIGATGETYLRVDARGGKSLAFFYSADGKEWQQAGNTLDVSALPQWDQGLSVGLLVSGNPHASASFKHFQLHSE